MYRDEAAQFQESLADVNQNKYWLLMLKRLDLPFLCNFLSLTFV